MCGMLQTLESPFITLSFDNNTKDGKSLIRENLTITTEYCSLVKYTPIILFNHRIY